MESNTIPEPEFSTQINVKMTGEMRSAFEAICREHELSVPHAIRRFITIAIDYEKETDELPLKHLRFIKHEPLNQVQIDPASPLPHQKTKHSPKVSTAEATSRAASKVIRGQDHNDALGYVATNARKPRKSKRGAA